MTIRTYEGLTEDQIQKKHPNAFLLPREGFEVGLDNMEGVVSMRVNGPSGQFIAMYLAD